jgi:hypothetical protein
MSSHFPPVNSTKSCLDNGSWSGLTDYHDCMCWGSGGVHVNHSICNNDGDNVPHNYHIYIHLVGKRHINICRLYIELDNICRLYIELEGYGVLYIEYILRVAKQSKVME